MLLLRLSRVKAHVVEERIAHRRALALADGHFPARTKQHAAWAQLNDARHVHQIAFVTLDEALGQHVEHLAERRVRFNAFPAHGVQAHLAALAFHELHLGGVDHGYRAVVLNGDGELAAVLQVGQRLIERGVEVGLVDGLEQEIRMLGLLDRRAELDMTGNVDDLGGASRGKITAHQIDARWVAFTQIVVGDEDVDAIIRGHKRFERGDPGYDVDVKP